MSAPAPHPSAHRGWERVATVAPQMVDTMQSYIDTVALTLAPSSVAVLETTLRQFAGRVVDADPTCISVAAITPGHVADFQNWLATKPSDQWGRERVSANTVDYRLRMLRVFFERVAKWGWTDSPAMAPLPRPDTARPTRITRKAGRRSRRDNPPATGSRPRPEMTWEEIAAHAPQVVATMRSYLAQLAVSSRPATVASTSLHLRIFAAHLVNTDPPVTAVAGIERRHIESYKLALVQRPGRSGKAWSPTTVRHNLGMVRSFLERIIDWDYPDAPRRVPIFAGDIPKADEPTPKFLDDPAAAKFMATLATDPNRRRRLMVELLARTGMRVGELAALRDDAMYRLGDTHWLKIPVGKLHNDRAVPLHPMLVGLINDYRQWRGPSTTGLLVERDDHQPFDRRTIHRYVEAVARHAQTGHVHPHQLRHTLATQCINRGMSLEAIAALLGHRSPRMTLVYARISDAVVAEQYFAATQAVETEAVAVSIGAAGDREEARRHRRLLGNGNCTRPIELDCRFQTICEGCGFFETGPEFVSILKRQRDDAIDHMDIARTKLYNDLVRVIDEQEDPKTA